MNLIAVAKGWYNYINNTKELRATADARLAICDTCPNKQQIDGLGVFIVTHVNYRSSVYKCELCGCPLAAKVFSLSNCPAFKW